MRPGSVSDAGTHEIAGLRADFPDYAISLEIVRDQARYVASSQHPGLSPHTVITADPVELRTLLGRAPAPPQPADEPPCGIPNIARMYDRWIGGKEHLAADRMAADGVLADYPQVASVAKANREFVGRAVAHVAAQSITQFIDIGTGLPATPSVDQIARHACPAARVVYVDNDPVVLAHARALLAIGPGVSVIDADLRRPTALLARAEVDGPIDLGHPVCLILAAVLHFLTADEADAIMATLRAAIAPGSYLILSAGTLTGTDPELIDRLRAAYAGTTVVTGRSEAEIAAYCTGLNLLPPGLTDVGRWRPDHWGFQPAPGARIVGVVARKPAAPAAIRRPRRRAAGTAADPPSTTPALPHA